MNNTIYPCLAIRGKMAEAADYYVDVFGEGSILRSNAFVIQLQLKGQKFMLLNEGPASPPNPAISFMVLCHEVEETEGYWHKLIEGGQVLMPLDTYSWSSKYGWLQDRYVVSWQLITGTDHGTLQKFCPSLMFVGPNAGKAAAAIDFYTHVFPDSNIRSKLTYEEGDGDRTDFIKHAHFTIDNFVMMAMDSTGPHQFNFADGISLVVECNTQEEIDRYWERLTADGGQEVACGWLTDKFGVSWQIVPKDIGKLVTDPTRGDRVLQAVMRMKKLIIAELENA